MAWVYVASLLASTLGSRLIVWRRDPDVLRERARFVDPENTEAWDRRLVPIVGILGPMLMMVVAGLDHRFGWSPTMPLMAEIIGVVLLAVGYGIAVWAMVVNRFFSSVARIQEDRGHQVVQAGPYRVLRHPAYAGAVLASLAVPFMLGALFALIPGALLIGALVLRTSLEDQMLISGLEGYSAYATKTRFRLLPGIW
jgi:protein-S-isoprenylcysteine O-methyltransferase Ste14